MKAIKLSQEEKKEAKQAAKSFNELIRQAKLKGALVEPETFLDGTVKPQPYLYSVDNQEPTTLAGILSENQLTADEVNALLDMQPNTIIHIGIVPVKKLSMKPESDKTLDGLRKLRNDMNVAKLLNSTAIVELQSCGNPDFGQSYGTLSPKQLQPCKTYADAVNLCREYISQYNLGGGNWNGGFIYHPIKGIVARISYNGRVWEATDKNLDYRNPSKEITETNLNII